MSQKKRGRPSKPSNEVSSPQRQVHVAQMDFQKLEECYQQLTGDASKSIWDASEKLSSKAVSEIIGLFIVMAEERDEKRGGKGKKAEVAVPEKLMPSARQRRLLSTCGRAVWFECLGGAAKCHEEKLGPCVLTLCCLLKIGCIYLLGVDC